ncbi:MAG TPA: hypothetical protein VFU13_02300 [Steroidobacteraceae bacterium]|nr:hypothetical protein [Steroidobacteraceae bacterium]
MAVESLQLSSVTRDAYWHDTHAQLKSVRKRGDILSLLGLGLVGVLLWQYQYRESGDYAVAWAIGIATVSLVGVALPQLFVTRSKRRISAMRGMHCQHCGYVPHDTEISELVSTRECNRCRKPLG